MKKEYRIEIIDNDVKIKSNDFSFSTFRNGEQTSFLANSPKYDRVIDRANDYCIEIGNICLELNKLFN